VASRCLGDAFAPGFALRARTAVNGCGSIGDAARLTRSVRFIVRVA
jgi:hypothetical protein